MEVQECKWCGEPLADPNKEFCDEQCELKREAEEGALIHQQWGAE